MIKPIRTSTDLNHAKARISELLAVGDNGSYDDEIEVLTTLIEQYERVNVRIDAPSPIAAIKFRMEMMGLSPRQLEPFIGSRARVSEILSGRRQLSIDMIRSLHEGLSIPYESLISKRADTNLDEVSVLAIRRFKKLGFEVGSEELSPFLNTINQITPSPALLKQTRTQRAASKIDQNALLLWQAAVLKKSADQELKTTFNKVTFGRDVLRTIARLSAKSDGPTRAVSELSGHGVSVVTLPQLPGTFLDGVAMVTPQGKPVVGLTLRYDRIDSFWFTLLHELSHISLHYEYLESSGTAFVDDMEIKSEDTYEREADELARESLIPKSILNQIHWTESTTQDEILSLSIRARVHVAIAAGRWQRDHQNYKKFARLIDRGTLRKLFEGAL